MPGRKSNVSATSNGPEEVAESTPSRQTKDKDGLSVDDLSLPKSMVARLAKGVLPANTQIHKDALLALHKSATVFVSYIASNSNDNAQASGKKTIAPHDVIAALKDAELEMFLPRLEAELKKYNETQCDKRNTYRRKVKEEKAAAAAKDGDGEGEGDSTLPLDPNEPTNGTTANGHTREEDGVEPPSKKLKRENGDSTIPLDADDADDDDDGGDDANDQDDEDDEAVDDDVDDEEDDDGVDETMEDALEEQEEEAEERSGMVDEALDDPDSD
ncbi:hypothetical protein M409DRAFT_69233 [Zasmidium cellare ATCC 36951]|uniref:DNA polymerase epsilon subunit D n=1 Tax=Zasmidium cellare ATCC 36951 TaxID=1080233 RepID=A0A6A6C5G4_ZASCE|nr:uncharacterized protein M409DRAFT_69233 [Zasmidium cellare ATCC 36951]KAF2162344.1 hypothetical protein M409DRAFT_69233 [Zasmidium cellare ATCC 36951]